MSVLDNPVFVSDTHSNHRTNVSQPLFKFNGVTLRFNAAFRSLFNRGKYKYITFIIKETVPYLVLSTKPQHSSSLWLQGLKQPSIGKSKFVTQQALLGINEDTLFSIGYFKLHTISNDEDVLILSITPSVNEIELFPVEE